MLKASFRKSIPVFACAPSELKILQDFCEFVNQEYKKILGCSKTRWLALLPSVEWLLNMLLPLKSFFQISR
jgi:hypothetical protein